MFRKIIIILSSRFKTKKSESWIEDRREECLKCNENSLNNKSYNVYKKLLKKLSDFYSYITGKSEEDSLGNCMACEACSIYYKTQTKVEYCPKEKWKK